MKYKDIDNNTIFGDYTQLRHYLCNHVLWDMITMKYFFGIFAIKIMYIIGIMNNYIKIN